MAEKAKKEAEKAFINDALVRARKPTDEPQLIIWDTTTKGFGLRVTHTGIAAFIYNYRPRIGGKDATSKRYTIGRAGIWEKKDDGWRWREGDWPTMRARRRVQELAREVAGGGDPMKELRDERKAATVSDLADDYITKHARPKKRASSASNDESMIRRWVKPELGAMKVKDVSFDDIDSLHRKITKAGTPISANRAVALLSNMFSMSIKWRMRADNPCKVQRNAETSRQRYLSPEELKRLVQALNAHPNQQAADVVRLLLRTGARKSEAMKAPWSQFDLSQGIWSKPPSSTKQKSNHTVALDKSTLAILKRLRAAADAGLETAARLEREAESERQPSRRDATLNAARWARRLHSSAFVFPGRHVEEDQPLDNITKFWKSILEAAELKDFHLHDVRHSFASFAINDGWTLVDVGGMLGHSQIATTQRYSHVFRERQEKLAAAVGNIITAAETGESQDAAGEQQ